MSINWELRRNIVLLICAVQCICSISRKWLTLSPGLTDTATTDPGMGERRILLVSSGTFSGMCLLRDAASLLNTRSLNWTHETQRNGYTDRERTLWWYKQPNERQTLQKTTIKPTHNTFHPFFLLDSFFFTV